MVAVGRSQGPFRDPGRDVDALRERRMRAVELFEAGRRQADVVAELGVSAQTASRWHRAWLDGGRDALAGAARLGRTPRLSDGQVAEVEAALLAGPTANGFGTDMWTLARVADVIERTTGVRYTLSQTWLILRQRLGWTRQRPARRAVERDDAAIETWAKQDWPRIKRGPDDEVPGSASRTKADSRSCP
ncbi:winged helix-turn-helix domain-containing protein [Dactylosporangium matsuzakiense]|nr:winged helix-turn-helix domain-containing protein [Dactylosporangium matsuzakiense]